MVWLHPTGWTLLVSGAVLYLLTLAVGPPPALRRRLLIVWGICAVLGMAALGTYFAANPGYEPVDEIPLEAPTVTPHPPSGG